MIYPGLAADSHRAPKVRTGRLLSPCPNSNVPNPPRCHLRYYLLLFTILLAAACFLVISAEVAYVQGSQTAGLRAGYVLNCASASIASPHTFPARMVDGEFAGMLRIVLMEIGCPQAAANKRNMLL